MAKNTKKNQKPKKPTKKSKKTSKNTNTAPIPSSRVSRSAAPSSSSISSLRTRKSLDSSKSLVGSVKYENGNFHDFVKSSCEDGSVLFVVYDHQENHTRIDENNLQNLQKIPPPHPFPAAVSAAQQHHRRLRSRLRAAHGKV